MGDAKGEKRTIITNSNQDLTPFYKPFDFIYFLFVFHNNINHTNLQTFLYQINLYSYAYVYVYYKVITKKNTPTTIKKKIKFFFLL